MYKKGIIGISILLSMNAFAASKGQAIYNDYNNFLFNGLTLEAIQKADLSLIDGKRTYTGNAITTRFSREMPNATTIETDENYTYIKIVSQFKDFNSCKTKSVDKNIKDTFRMKFSCRDIFENGKAFSYGDKSGSCPYNLVKKDDSASLVANINPLERTGYDSNTLRYGDIETSVDCDSSGKMTYEVKDVYRNKGIAFEQLKTFEFPEIELPENPADILKIETDHKSKLEMELNYKNAEECFEKAQQTIYMKYKDYGSVCSSKDRMKGDCKIKLDYFNVNLDFNENRFDKRIADSVGDWHLESSCNGGSFKLKSERLK